MNLTYLYSKQICDRVASLEITGLFYFADRNHAGENPSINSGLGVRYASLGNRARRGVP